MRLHNVLDDIKHIIPGDEYLEALSDDYKLHAQFDFGDIGPIPHEEWCGLQLYSMDLIKHDLFNTPYDHLTFTWRQTEKDGQSIDTMVCCQTLTVPEVRKNIPSFLDLWIFYKFNIKEIEEGATMYHSFHTMCVLPESAKIGKICTIPAEPMGNNNIITGKDRKKIPPDIQRMVQETVNDFLALVVMLHADGVERRTSQAPTQLNEKREKRGLLPIQPINEIFIRVGERTVHPSGQDEERSHASPRAHWRRGHVRRLPNKQLTNVRPCMVGAIGKEEPVKNNYTIKL